MNIFLSYSSSESEIAESVAYGLRDEGYSVFFDRTSLPPGENYHSRIRVAISECDLFIFFVSRDSLANGSYALTELGIARRKFDRPAGRVLPVMTSDIDLDTLPPFLNAVTILRPKGDLIAEVVSSVIHLLPPDNTSIQVISSLSSTGWMLHFDIICSVLIKEIFYRFDEESVFVSTGFSRIRDRRTGLVQPIYSVGVPLFRGTRTLHIKFVDADNQEFGPHTILLDSVKLIVAETQEILAMTESSWLEFREYPRGRMLLYFSHLLSYRNGLKEIQYSIDNATLSKRVRFRPDWSGPGAPGFGPDDDNEIEVEISMSAKFVMVKLVFLDGSEWPARRFDVLDGCLS